MDSTNLTALELTTSITWLAHLTERFANMRLAQASVPAGMSYARANLMLAVDSARAQGNSARMVDIALDLGVTGRTLTTMVDSLEKQSLITRKVDPDDRRAFQLELTSAGLDLLPALRQELAQAAEAVMNPLSESDRQQLLRIVTRLIERS